MCGSVDGAVIPSRPAPDALIGSRSPRVNEKNAPVRDRRREPAQSTGSLVVVRTLRHHAQAKFAASSMLPCPCNAPLADTGKAAASESAPRSSGDDAFGRLPLLDPTLQRNQGFQDIRAGPEGAMVHPRHHEQAEKILRATQRDSVFADSIAVSWPLRSR
jgi:hypothetical protein